MANGTVGVAQAATPDRQIDNSALTVGAQTVYRQRIEDVPSRASTYFAGVSGSITIPVTSEIVSLACHCTTAGSLTIVGGATIPVPANSQFAETCFDAPYVGVGAGSVVFTGTDSYYVRVRPVVA